MAAITRIGPGGFPVAALPPENAKLTTAGVYVLTDEIQTTYLTTAGVYALLGAIPPFEPTGPIITGAGIYIYFESQFAPCEDC